MSEIKPPTFPRLYLSKAEFLAVFDEAMEDKFGKRLAKLEERMDNIVKALTFLTGAINTLKG